MIYYTNSNVEIKASKERQKYLFFKMEDNTE